MTELDFQTIGSKIKKRRKSLGITQEAIANLLDINPSHISNIECGRANPSLTALVQIANILECSVDCFLEEEYTYQTDDINEDSLNKRISDKLKYCDMEKKIKILKMIDLL